MILSDIDFGGYYLNPNSYKELATLDSYQEFSDFKKKPGKLSFQKTVTYIVLMYDINNDVMKSMYKDYSTRKRECAILAEFKLDKISGRFDKDVEEMLIGLNEKVNKMIVRYVSFFARPEYYAILAYYEMLEKEVVKSLGNEYDKDTIANITKINTEITKNVNVIFGRGESEELKKALYRTLQSERLKLRPEFIARQIKNKELELESKPYKFK